MNQKGFSQLIIALGVVVILVLMAVGYFFIKPRLNPSPQTATSQPTSNSVSNELPLTINSPADKTETTESSITVTGSTVPNATVHVNEDTGQSDGSGNFSIQTSLDQGDNPLNVYVVDNKGNFAQREITVTNQNY